MERIKGLESVESQLYHAERFLNELAGYKAGDPNRVQLMSVATFDYGLNWDQYNFITKMLSVECCRRGETVKLNQETPNGMLRIFLSYADRVKDINNIGNVLSSQELISGLKIALVLNLDPRFLKGIKNNK